MAAPDYKKALSLLISDGTVTLQQVRDAVGRTWDVSKPVKVGPTWDAATKLLKAFNELLTSNHHRPARVNESAIACMERMIRLDGRSETECVTMIEWACSHDFWSSVILSPEKFRKHYATMEAQRSRDSRTPNTQAEEGQRVERAKAQSQEWEREIARRQEVSRPMPQGFKNVLKGKA